MKKNASPLSRRTFLRGAAAAAGAATFPAIIPASARGADGAVAPSERIAMAVIGLGGQGTRDMQDFLRFRDVQIVALCDVDEGSTRYENGWLRGLAPARQMARTIPEGRAMVEAVRKHKRIFQCGRSGSRDRCRARPSMASGLLERMAHSGTWLRMTFSQLFWGLAKYLGKPSMGIMTWSRSWLQKVPAMESIM